MNRHSLLAVALIAMVCTGLGVASVSDSQLPADVKDGLQVLYLSVTDTGNNTAVVTAMMPDGEDEHSFVFDPNEPLPEGVDPITDEDGNVIGASYNATDGSGAAFGTMTTTITDDDLPDGFDPRTDKVGAYDVTMTISDGEDGNVIVTDEDGNVVGTYPIDEIDDGWKVTDKDGTMTVTDEDGNVIGWGYGYRDDTEESNGGF